MKKTFIALISLLTLFGCRPDRPEKELTYLELRLSSKIGNDDLTFNQTITNDLGIDYSFTRCSIYMSNFQLGELPIEDSYVFINATDLTQTIFEVEPGTYNSVSFISGLDSLTNHSDPSVHEEGHPLELQNPSTHWNWASGYLMIILEGDFDSDGNGSLDNSFIYHVGGKDIPKEFNIAKSIEILPGTVNYLDLKIDWTKFVANIDFPNQQSTHTMDDPLTANQIADESNVAISID